MSSLRDYQCWRATIVYCCSQNSITDAANCILYARRERTYCTIDRPNGIILQLNENEIIGSLLFSLFILLKLRWIRHVCLEHVVIYSFPKYNAYFWHCCAYCMEYSVRIPLHDSSLRLEHGWASVSHDFIWVGVSTRLHIAVWWRKVVTKIWINISSSIAPHHYLNQR